MSTNSLIIYTDGGSRSNPGEAAYGFVIYDEKKISLVKIGKKIGIATNNIAEYSGVLEALYWVENNLTTPLDSITFYLDSLLVVQQLKGKYKIKNKNLLESAIKIQLVEKNVAHKISYNHIPRDKNKEADLLVNQALDNLI